MNSEMVYKALSCAMDKRKLISVIYIKRTNDYYHTGFVNSITEASFTIEKVDEFGNVEGLYELELDGIDELVYNSPYLRGIELIIENHVCIEKPDEKRIHVRKKIKDSLEKFVNSEEIVTLCFRQDMEYIGYVINVDTQFVEIHALDGDTGESDGRVYVRLSSISSIIYAGPVEQKARYLHEHFMR